MEGPRPLGHGLIDLDTLLQDWVDGPDFTHGDPRRVEMAYERDG